MSNNTYALNYGNLLEFDINVEDLSMRIDADVGIMNYDESHLTTLPKLKSERLHHHDAYEFFFNLTEKLRGSFEDGLEVDFDEATLIVVPPGIRHRFYEDSWVNSLSFKFTISKNVIKSKLNVYSKFLDFCSYPYASLKCDDKMKEILLSLRSAVKSRNSLLVSSYMYNMIARVIGTQKNLYDEGASLRTDSNQSRSHKVHIMIEHYYTSDISLKDIADALSISNRQLIRIVKQLYGCTFREQVTKLRMDTAANLLKNTDMNVTELASKLGYNSSNGFSQVFKKSFGISPSGYRKKALKEIQE